jgi:broad specificity phosphatase PhoE
MADRPALRLLLVRHGETAFNRQMRYLGTLDEPLAAAGVAQAGRLAEALAPLPLAAVYASPLARTAATAERIAAACALPLRLEPRLREQAFGEWEGLTRAEVLGRGDRDRELLRRWEEEPAVGPPGGEPLAAVQERVLGMVGQLAAEPAAGSSGGRRWVALVSHVGPIKALLCAALGVPLAAARRLFLDPGTLTVVDWGERPVIRLFNAQGLAGGERWIQDK